MHNENKVPLIRLAKRDMMEPWKVWCIRLASIVLALLLGGLVMMIALPDGATPIDGYATIITGALGKKTAIRQTVKLAVPLLGCALAIAPCFKMRFWNIGAEGQITAGAIAASYFALYWVGKVPSAVLLLIMGLAGAVAGGIWALIPAFFKAKWNTNETLFTLMMNYIIIGVVRWLQGGPWEGRPGSQIIPQFDRAATLPKVLGVHCGWIIVLILVVFMHVYMNHTKHGYEIAVHRRLHQHRPLRGHERWPRHDAHDVPLRRDLRSGRLHRRLRREHHALRRRRRRRRLHLHHGRMAQPAQRLRDDRHFHDARGHLQGRRNASDPSGRACLDLRHHHGHPALLYARLRVLHQLSTHLPLVEDRKGGG